LDVAAAMTTNVCC